MHPFLIIGAFLKCEIAKKGFMKNNISQGFEALARAQCLLRSKISLGKMTLLSQVSSQIFYFLFFNFQVKQFHFLVNLVLGIFIICPILVIQ